ncbi:hypothetical protein B0A89_13240 [Paracoccus contaminans]|uniref:Uncharacterized protein n=2 Tax=Paracoccus contaminans TaxID=1945662 RepID=A0A1W6D098_9RHOB|nr:hypothetical protein B0A89_13240 [Paracoccus contaminans]
MDASLRRSAEGLSPVATGKIAPASAAPLRPAPGGGPNEARHRADQQPDARAGEGNRAAPLTGPGDLLAEAMGRAELPPPLQLIAALEAAERHAPLADRAVPGLGALIRAVIQDERFKLARMMDLGR